MKPLPIALRSTMSVYSHPSFIHGVLQSMVGTSQHGRGSYLRTSGSTHLNPSLCTNTVWINSDVTPPPNSPHPYMTQNNKPWTLMWTTPMITPHRSPARVDQITCTMTAISHQVWSKLTPRVVSLHHVSPTINASWSSTHTMVIASMLN
jgi:hypothetical protein